MGQLRWSRTSFRSSLVPMVIADDHRRYVAVNAAACLLLRLPEEDVLRLRVDDLTPPDNRVQVEPLWRAFILDGVQEGTFEMVMPDGARLQVEYSATAHVEPGRHLSILMFPATGGHRRVDREADRPAVLTGREREVLGMVAMGRGSSWIASELGVSASTVETHVRHLLDKLGPGIGRTRSRSDCRLVRSASTSPLSTGSGIGCRRCLNELAGALDRSPPHHRCEGELTPKPVSPPRRSTSRP